MAKYTSTHIVKGKKVKVDRVFDQIHLDAGYHTQEFGEHSHTKHKLLGVHETKAGPLKVEHTEGPPTFGQRVGIIHVHTGEVDDEGKPITEQRKEVVHDHVLASGSITHGPEFKLTLPDGVELQVLCADVVQQYIDLHNGKEIE